MQIPKLSQKSDVIGAWASTLCLIHCLSTPFIFVVQAEIINHLQWWKMLDLFFLIISFIAILRSVKTSSKKWIKIALWVSWTVLMVVILNEKFAVFPLAEQAIYSPTIGLVFFHLYSQKYCQCSHKNCCTEV